MIKSSDIKKAMKLKFPLWEYKCTRYKGKIRLSIVSDTPRTPEEKKATQDYLEYIMAHSDQFVRFKPISARATEHRVLRDGVWEVEND